MKIRFSLRIISLLLAVLTLFSLAACSSGKNTQTDTSKPTESEKATEKATDSTEKNDPEQYVDEHKAVCIVAKNRHGRTGDVPLYWDGEHTRFTSVATNVE